MRIGYQGIEGSNSEYAAKVFAEKIGMSQVEFVPLISSLNVLGGLKRKEIEYGVFATKNSIGGLVAETCDIIKIEYLELVSTEIIPICQSLSRFF